MKKVITYILILVFIFPIQPVYAGNTDTLSFMEEKVGGYDRSLFKHWIDEDKDGCDTRKEVLIEEAIVKPKIGKKCVYLVVHGLVPMTIKQLRVQVPH